MQDIMIEGKNGDVYFTTDQLMDVSVDGYIIFEG